MKANQAQKEKYIKVGVQKGDENLKSWTSSNL